MTTAALWTLDELTRRVGEALAVAADAGAYPGAPNGRTREVPDQRAIRWYATRGLLDRPATRGRTVGYGPRHLMQLVLIKQRQAQGRSLAEIQAELAGATDSELRALSGVPDALLAGARAAAPPPGAAAATSVRGRFWADPQSAAPDPQSAALKPTPAAPDPLPAASDLLPAAPDPTSSVTTADGVLTGVPLAAGAILLLPAAPDAEALAAIHVTAQPLLDLLIDRGLLDPSRRSPR